MKKGKLIYYRKGDDEVVFIDYHRLRWKQYFKDGSIKHWLLGSHLDRIEALLALRGYTKTNQSVFEKFISKYHSETKVS